jgi:putative transposase
VGDGEPHEDGARGRRAGDGGLEAQAIRRTRASFRRGAQYTAISFGKRLADVGIVPSMGRTGTALDNAMAESFIATLKTELVHRRRFPDREVARSAVFEYLEGFYNRRRLHSALSYQSPMSYEEATMEGAAVA